MQTLAVSNDTARLFLLRAFALESRQSLATVSQAITALEFVQEDSIAVCWRMHDLILFPRVADYTPQLLADTLYGAAATAFEVHFPNLAALPRSDYPHFVRRMQARRTTPGRWQGLLPDEEPVAAAFLQALDTLGPLTTRLHGNDFGHTQSGWGSRATVLSQVVEKLWLQGIVGIAGRQNFERRFDRLERLAPELAAWHDPDAPLPTPSETELQLVRKRLRAKALFRPSRQERQILGEGALVRVEIQGIEKPWYILAERLPLLRECSDLPRADSEEALLLAPLDPLVYDRVRTRELFGFDYRWEVYVPQARRRWGYYVLPILWKGALIGGVDLKRESKDGTLHLRHLFLQPHVRPEIVAEPIAQALIRQARFLGGEQIRLGGICPDAICNSLASYLDRTDRKR